MVKELLAMSITLNIMFFTVIYFNAKDRKERIKGSLDNIEVLLAKLKNDLNKIDSKFENDILEKLEEIDQELRK
ncbi:hypothetical protein [Clostridium sp. C8-1-8]|uniref:hypothetical protein n=1 Tax=Clostridium sp. C8-1-8 TaxID=2698831 RepID=UPI00136DD75E|nr:hypothetical protein [Clostridium sp. C8-1-8]